MIASANVFGVRAQRQPRADEGARRGAQREIRLAQIDAALGQARHQPAFPGDPHRSAAAQHQRSRHRPVPLPRAQCRRSSGDIVIRPARNRRSGREAPLAHQLAALLVDQFDAVGIEPVAPVARHALAQEGAGVLDAGRPPAHRFERGRRGDAAPAAPGSVETPRKANSRAEVADRVGMQVAVGHLVHEARMSLGEGVHPR